MRIATAMATSAIPYLEMVDDVGVGINRRTHLLCPSFIAELDSATASLCDG
jgi:hypothetical protein